MQKAAETEQLDASRTDQLLSRVPAIKTSEDDTTDFAKRVGSLPAPKTGTKIPVKFPSDSSLAPPSKDPANSLEVVRYSPEGDVPLAPDLNVTFSQPMVAVTSQEQAAQYAPVELSPQVEGRWRWLGTKTLMFDTTKRFPMATEFTARVPAGTKSANGLILKKDVVWKFKTPPPKVLAMVPANQTVKRDALMLITFDQQIDPSAVLRNISVTAAGKRITNLRLATQSEIDGELSLLSYLKDVQPGRWLAFRAVNADGSTANALPPASEITVTVNAGTPSAEGPLTTITAQAYTFRTYGPFKFVSSYCGYQNSKECKPFDGWQIEFTNAIDGAKFTKEMVTVTPAVEGLNIFPSGNTIYIQNYKKGRTTYTVRVDAGLTDAFGQTLSEPVTAIFKVGTGDANLYAAGRIYDRPRS